MPRRRTSKSLDGIKRIYWRRNQWQYKATSDEREQGLKAWEPLGESEPVARLKYAEIKNALGQMGGMNLMLDKFINEVVMKKKADRTRKDDLNYIDKLRPVFGKMDPFLIKPKHVQMYVDRRAESSVAQARKEFSVLNQLSKRMLVWIDLPSNPCDGVVLPTKLKSRDRLPEPWEIAEVRKFARPQWQLYIDFKFATGLDQGVILAMEIDKVLNSKIANFVVNGNDITITADHLREDGIKVRRSKTQVRGALAWTPDLEKIVLDIFRLRANEKRYGSTLFCSNNGNGWTKDTFNNGHGGWQEAKRKALSEGKLEENFTEHDIRASHLKAAEELGFDGTVQLLHSDPRTTNIYRRAKETKVIQPVNLQKALDRSGENNG